MGPPCGILKQVFKQIFKLEIDDFGVGTRDLLIDRLIISNVCQKKRCMNDQM